MTPDDLVGIPYRLGGRDASGIDCHGVALRIAWWHQFPVPDTWAQLEENYRAGRRGIKSTLEALPSAFVKTRPPPRDGDWIITPGHVSAYSGGWVYSAGEQIGGTRQSWAQFCRRADFSLWRWNGSA